ncbi:MAG: hypothetical protein M1816_005014 [Peltula sp. TS41687]|nr:MAG: hypothetical protein M1816_005014 [Peltula sp. TS41687]
MRFILTFFPIFPIVTVTTGLCVPSRRSNDRAILSIDSNKEPQTLLLPDTWLDAERTGHPKNSDLLMKRNSNDDQELRQQSNSKPSSRANGDDDGLNPQEPDASSLGEAEGEEDEAATAKPDAPTMDEVKQFLTPEEKEAFLTARRRLSWYNYPAALKAAKQAEAENRELTAEESENLRHAREANSGYKKWRRLGVKRLVESGQARPEVIAYWKKTRKSTAATYKNMTEAERKVHNKRKWEKARKVRDAKNARLDELEARFQTGDIKVQELQELEELRAWRDRNVESWRAQKQKQTREQLDARNARVQAQRQQQRAEKKAAREALEARIKDDSATPEDRQEWARIQEKEEQARTEQAIKKAHLQELEEKFRRKKATPAEKKEWAQIEAKRARHRVNEKSSRERRKQGIASGKGNRTKGDQRKGGRKKGVYQEPDGAVDQADNSASTENGPPPNDTTDLSANQPLQSNDNLQSPPGTGSGLRDPQQAHIIIPTPAGTHFSQLRTFPASSRAPPSSTMKDRVVDGIKQMRDGIVNGLGRTINQANAHPSMESVLGGKPPSMTVPSLGNALVF